MSLRRKPESMPADCMDPRDSRSEVVFCSDMFSRMIWARQQETVIPRKRKPLTNKAGEVREITEEDFRNFKPFSSLPVGLQAKLLRGRGKQVAPTKQAVSLRLSPEVVAFFKAKSKGWQTRIDDALKVFVEVAK